jgi:predicted ribosome-associated RNA-binding protein Tma20
VEALYADGRDMAIYMYDSLLAINSDFSRYPTLTAIIEAFKNSWAYENYDKEVPDVAKATCAKHEVNLWSVNQMAALFKKQEQLLAAVCVTLQILKDSDLYKMENGIKTMKQETNIHVSGVSGSSININSAGATASVTNNYNEPTIFADLITAIKSNNFDGETESKLIDNVQALAASHQSGGFKEVYKDFMQNVSAHMTVFSPFITGLSALL